MIRVQTWSLLRRYIVLHLYDFVVDVHGKNYYHDCIVSYFTTLFKFLGDSLVVFQSIFRMRHKTVLGFIVDVDKRLVCQKLQWVLLY